MRLFLLLRGFVAKYYCNNSL